MSQRLPASAAHPANAAAPSGATCAANTENRETMAALTKTPAVMPAVRAGGPPGRQNVGSGMDSRRKAMRDQAKVGTKTLGNREGPQSVGTVE